MTTSVEQPEVVRLLISTVVGFIAGYAAFEAQEWRRRRRHAQTLRAALQSELERLDRVLASFVYLWDHEAEPTKDEVEEVRRLHAEGGQWGDEDPDLAKVTARSPDELATILRLLPPRGLQTGPTIKTTRL